MSKWRAVQQAPLYEVSDEGDIRRCKGGPGARLGHTLRGTVTNGYRTITIPCADGRVRTLYVHRLVCATFCGGLLPGQVVRHLDGDRSNNHFSNLLPGTRSENVLDAKRHGTFVPPPKRHGAQAPQARLTEEQVIEIRGLHPAKGTMKLSREFGVSPTTISSIAHRKTWSHLP